MAIKIYPKASEFPYLTNVANVTPESIIIDSDTKTTSETITKSLDEYMEDSGINWQTPMQYYSKRKTAQTSDDGYVDISKSDIYDDVRVYFWVEDLHNWCTYECRPIKCTINETNEVFDIGLNIQLRVWNGVNGWIDINNRADENGNIDITHKRDRIPLNVDQDLYNILPYQAQFVDKLNGGSGQYMQFRHRGHVIVDTVTLDTEPDTESDEKLIGPSTSDSNIFPYTVVNGFRLQKMSKYSINTNNFSTKRPKNNYTSMSTMALNTDYTTTNVREFIQTGNFPVWRMSSNEIFLATEMQLNTDAGIPYELRYISFADSRVSTMAAIVKIPNKDLIKSPRTQMYNEYRKFTSRYSLGITKNMVELTKFVNNKCLESFGDGNTKTITNDWLREYKNTDIVSSPSDYNNMLDSRLMFEQVNSNNKNSMKCSFKVNRPIIITDEQAPTDYIKKW